MDKIILPDNKEYIVYENTLEVNHYETQRKMAILSAWDLMNNCIDTIYENTVKYYPKVFRPTIYIVEWDIPNAFAYKSNIYVTTGLIFNAVKLIAFRYTEDLMGRYNILHGVNINTIKAGIRVYFWRFVVLHELYHIWHNHLLWESIFLICENDFLFENNCNLQLVPNPEEILNNIVQQTLEYDADISAMCSLINLLIYDVETKRIENKSEFIKQNLAEMMAALSTMFCLLDGYYGAKFEKLNSLCNEEHPIPSIRLFYLEETADAMLWQYFDNENEIFELESEWQKMVCDIEADFKGKVEMGQVFYFTAYTEKAQEHLKTIKEKFNEIHNTLSKVCLSSISEKLDESYIEYSPVSIWFTDEGVGLKRWNESININN